MKNRLAPLLPLLLLLALLPSCKKYLSVTPDISVIVPNSVASLQSMLDINSLTQNSTPGLTPLAVTDFMVTDSTWVHADAGSQGASTWQPAIYQGSTDLSWSSPYAAIFTCNSVLAGLNAMKKDSGGSALFNAVYGGALFTRAFLFFRLEETFGQPYRPSYAGTDTGIVLRLGIDLQQPTTRSSVAAVYAQIDSDLTRAIPLLPTALQTANRNRPCRSAAMGLLAAVYLAMQEYPLAGSYADSSLKLYDSLVDYNTVDSTKPYPFPTGGNAEVLFQCSAVNYPMQYGHGTLIDTTLYDSYDPNDLRRSIFFQKVPSGGHNFRGGYTGKFYLFSGVAVDEILLIRAECAARTGDSSTAIADLHTLLSHRWRNGAIQAYQKVRQPLLQWVLQEKRKETLFREVRWTDLRRLNQNPLTADTLYRTIGNMIYTLPPGSPMYTFFISETEIRLSGIPQN